MSNKKSKNLGGVVKKKTTDVFEVTPDPIPSGEMWIINEFGGVDINNGDNLSSVFKLKYGDEVLDGGIIAATGNTIVLKNRWEIIGDGTKKITIERTNNSNNNKELPSWVKVFKRS